MENLNKLINSDRLSHAYILSSSSSDALKDAAAKFANLLICKIHNSCGECGPCIRLKTGNYPDIIVIDGFENSPKKEDIILIQQQFSESSSEGNKKIYIIHCIERLSTVGANSLLKFLEEPPLDTIAILTTLDSNSLLPTIKSRSITINIPEVKRETLIDMLVAKGIDKEVANKYVEVANDSNLNTDSVDVFNSAFNLANNKDFTRFMAEFTKDKEAIIFFIKTLISNAKKSKDKDMLAKYLFALEMINKNANAQLVLETLK